VSAKEQRDGERWRATGVGKHAGPSTPLSFLFAQVRKIFKRSMQARQLIIPLWNINKLRVLLYRSSSLLESSPLSCLSDLATPNDALAIDCLVCLLKTAVELL
jgi:hypothetical protein